MKIHSEEKPYCCTFCTKSFTYNGNLKNHLRKHSRQNPHPYILCPKSFIGHGKLKKHIEEKNSITALSLQKSLHKMEI